MRAHARAQELMKEDPEMAEMAAEEVAALTSRCNALESRLTVLLLPGDPLDNKNIMLEASAPCPGCVCAAVRRSAAAGAAGPARATPPAQHRAAVR